VTGDNTAESDVTVDVLYDCPTIEIDDPEDEDSFEWQDDVTVKATVTAPGQDSVVEDVVFEFEYDGVKNPGGAVTYVSEDGLGNQITWTNDEGEVEYTFELEDDEMWRAGPWVVTATVYCTEEDCEDEEDCYDYDTVDVTVDDYLKIHWAEDGEATGEPGQDLYGEDFNVPAGDIPSDNQDHPEIKITSNENWELELTPGVAVHETEGDEYTLDVNGDYAYDLGTPRMGDVIEINYDVEIPFGHMHGSYSTAYEYEEVNESVSHRLSVYCKPLQEETAFGGDTEGEGAGWWYYYDTSGDMEQTIWAGQDIDVGTVTVSELENGEVTITMELSGDWYLQVDDESVKIQGYEEGDLPDSRPVAGQFDTYKGYELEVTFEPEEDFEYYVIHLDVVNLSDE